MSKKEPGMSIPGLFPFLVGLDEKNHLDLILEMTTRISDCLEESLNEDSYVLPDIVRENLFDYKRELVTQHKNLSTYQSVFMGIYDQTWRDNGEVAFRMPFFLVQQQEEEVIQGYIKDMSVDFHASFEGRIHSGVDIEFEKRYGAYPSIIQYKGKFSSKRKMYLGEWEITNHIEGNITLETNGVFLMKEIYHTD